MPTLSFSRLVRAISAPLLMLLLGHGLPLSARAQAPVFLNKAETEAISKGKVWNMIRYADANKIRVEFRTNGYAYANNTSLNGNDSAKWYVNDQGYLCATWRSMGTETCAMIQKGTDKYVIFMAENPAVPAFEFTIP